ncbi:hypothetical protein BD408DRAFT_412112 [Parasitella parasitica]|nr:hypothetical protein BD408DRAFT_412112 [Parasitella parasitica]
MEDIIDKEITVHVRSPSLNETLQVKTTLNATVLTLKSSIEPVHPHHPKPANQRIIYSGKLLEDTDMLVNLLKKNDQQVIPTFHLVVKPSPDASASRTQTPLPTITPPPCPQQPQHSNPFSFSGIPHNTGFTMPQHQYQQQPQPAYPSSLPGGYQIVYINGQYYLAPTLVLSQNLPPQQSANTQMFPTAQHSLYQQPPAAFASHQPPTQQQQQQQQQEPIVQPYINQLAQPQQHQQQQQQNNPIFGANGPILAQPANAQRAASIWLALKLIVVLFMLCQGASIERIFIFHVIAFVFFFYQTGRLRFVLRRVRVEDLNRFRPGNDGGLQRPAPPPAASNPTPNVNGNPSAEGASTSVASDNSNLTQRRQDSGEASASGENATFASNHAAANEPARLITALDVWKRGVYTFFASLWPTYGVDSQIAQAFQNDNNNNNQEQ